jgi:hypothetical protein
MRVLHEAEHGRHFSLWGCEEILAQDLEMAGDRGGGSHRSALDKPVLDKADGDDMDMHLFASSSPQARRCSSRLACLQECTFTSACPCQLRVYATSSRL